MQLEYVTLLSLFGAAWVTFVPVATATKTLNEVRDKVLTLGDTYSMDHRELMLKNDWQPIFVGSCVGQIVVSALVIAAPWILDLATAGDRITLGLCISYAVFGVGRLWLFASTHMRDFRFMRKHLDVIERSETPPGEFGAASTRTMSTLQDVHRENIPLTPPEISNAKSTATRRKAKPRGPAK